MAASTIPASSQPEALAGRSVQVLLDGYISRCFGSRQAEQYICCLLKTHGVSSHPASYYQGRESAFFIATSVPQHISVHFPGRSTWVLDRGLVEKGTVIPQTLWAPHTINDKKQHITDAELWIPIFFEGLDGTLGLSLEAAASGRCHGLVDAQAFAPLGSKSTTHFRIVWPGYLEYKRQVQIRDETIQHNPITIARFAHHAGRSVEAFLRSSQPDPGCQDPRRDYWRIGAGGIVREDIVIIGAIHVSAGSWMPILQLNHYIL